MDTSLSSSCAGLPAHLTSFIDTFIDYSVSGLFLLPENPSPNRNPKIPTRIPTPPNRLVAVGDLHGDLKKSKEALKIAGLINEADSWIGGDTTVVQIGDVLDRGGDELKILYFLEKLKREAFRHGGSILTMNGNHEVMNIDGDFRYVTVSGFNEFKAWADWYRIGISMKSLFDDCFVNKDIFQGVPQTFPRVKREFHEGFRARVAALRPNGPISTRFFSQNSTVLVIGDSVFVHGGLLLNHVSYGLERINEEVSDWINGSKRRVAPGFVKGGDSVVWSRKFSDQVCDCLALQHVLDTIPGAKRMIMGHTIQETGINGVCDNRAIRIDVGMSKGCGDGLPQVLEIDSNSELHVLSAKPLPQKRRRRYDEKEGIGFLKPEHGPQQIQVEV